MLARSIAISRAQHLIQFIAGGSSSGGQSATKVVISDIEPDQHFLTMLTDTFWQLLRASPPLRDCAPLHETGLQHVELVVGGLVDIIYAFALVC